MAPDYNERAPHRRWQQRCCEYEEDITDLVKNIEIPALALHRRGDQVIPFEAGREMALLLRNCRFVPLEGNVHIEIGEDVLSEIIGFLDEEEQRTGRRTFGSSPDSLSRRQRQVLNLIAAGKSSREIAIELVLSERTVERHVADVYAKIGVGNRAEATAFALNHPHQLPQDWVEVLRTGSLHAH